MIIGFEAVCFGTLSSLYFRSNYYSLSRATVFNKHNMSHFYENLQIIIEKDFWSRIGVRRGRNWNDHSTQAMESNKLRRTKTIFQNHVFRT